MFVHLTLYNTKHNPLKVYNNASCLNGVFMVLLEFMVFMVIMVFMVFMVIMVCMVIMVF